MVESGSHLLQLSGNTHSTHMVKGRNQPRAVLFTEGQEGLAVEATSKFRAKVKDAAGWDSRKVPAQ